MTIEQMKSLVELANTLAYYQDLAERIVTDIDKNGTLGVTTISVPRNLLGGILNIVNERVSEIEKKIEKL